MSFKKVPVGPVVTEAINTTGKDYLVIPDEECHARCDELERRLREAQQKIDNLVEQSQFWGGPALDGLAEKGAQLQAERDSFKRDAERWRMLRALSHHIVLQIIQSDWSRWEQLIDERIDLDAALAEREKP